MYPQQQQQQQIVPFTNYHQQQQYYSSSTNPFLWAASSSSLPSDSSTLHPPGTEPVSNSNVFDPNSTLSAYSYGAQPSDSQNWVVNYDAAVGSSTNETSVVPSSLPLTWNDTWLQQHFTSAATAVLPNQTKAAKSMRCEVCKIDCNSKEVYETHISGKKHKKNLQIQANPTNTTSSGPSQAIVQSKTSSSQGQVLTGPVDSKKRKVSNGGAPVDSVKVCSVCNIVCNSQEVYNKHLAGKKHAAQVALMSNNGIGPYIAAFKREGAGPWKKAPKKIKVVQPSWCEVCKVNCNSPDMYAAHISGKKHLKNVEKLSKPKNDTGSGAGAANASQGAANLIIGPQEKPATDKPKAKKAPDMDIELKKRKVVEGGAAAADVRLCTLCNVVCNSEVVYNDHLSGHKHAAMVKKHAESRIETTTG